MVSVSSRPSSLMGLEVSPLGDLLEAGSVGLESGLLSGEILPALDRDIDIAGINIHVEAGPAGRFGGDDRGSASNKGVVNRVATIRMVEDGAPHQFYLWPPHNPVAPRGQSSPTDHARGQ